MELFNRAFFWKIQRTFTSEKKVGESREDFQCYWKWFIGAKADDVKIQKSIFENSNFATLSCRRLIANFCSRNLNPLRKKSVKKQASAFKIITNCTVWKFQNFCITEILREINFEDSRSPKSAILTHLQALNWIFALFEG